eukprot:1184574-Prorocentrum_minimum.AAC.2
MKNPGARRLLPPFSRLTPSSPSPPAEVSSASSPTPLTLTAPPFSRLTRGRPLHLIVNPSALSSTPLRRGPRQGWSTGHEARATGQLGGPASELAYKVFLGDCPQPCTTSTQSPLSSLTLTTLSSFQCAHRKLSAPFRRYPHAPSWCPAPSSTRYSKVAPSISPLA